MNETRFDVLKGLKVRATYTAVNNSVEITGQDEDIKIGEVIEVLNLADSSIDVVNKTTNNWTILSYYDFLNIIGKRVVTCVFIADVESVKPVLSDGWYYLSNTEDLPNDYNSIKYISLERYLQYDFKNDPQQIDYIKNLNKETCHDCNNILNNKNACEVDCNVNGKDVILKVCSTCYNKDYV